MIGPMATRSETRATYWRALTSGRGAILLAALLWSTSGLFAKAPVFEYWPPGERGALMAFWRALFAGLLLLPAVRGARFTPRLVPMVACFGGMNVTYLTAMTLTSAANAIWLQSTAPLWVFLLAVLVVREPFDTRDLVPLAFGLCGVATIVVCESSGTSKVGVAYGLAAGVFYAGVVLSLRALRTENGAWLVAVNHLGAAAILFPYVCWLGEWPRVAQLVTLAAFGGLQMGLPYWLFSRGLRTVPSTQATLIALIEPVVMPLWVFLVWGERAAWWTIAGAALILVGLVVRYWSDRRGTRKPIVQSPRPRGV